MGESCRADADADPEQCGRVLDEGAAYGFDAAALRSHLRGGVCRPGYRRWLPEIGTADQERAERWCRGATCGLSMGPLTGRARG